MADQESQSWPLAPARLHQRSDDENPAFKALRKERTNKCFVYIFAGIVFLCAILLIFALIVFRIKSPDVRLRSVAVKSLRYSNSSSPSPSLNATLVFEVTIRNPNFGPYVFGNNNSVSFLYGGAKLGEHKIGGGEARWKGTERMNITMEVRSSRLPEGSNNLSGDLNSGFVNLSSYCRFTGKVHLLKIFKNRKTAQMNCTMTLVLRTKTIKDLRCD